MPGPPKGVFDVLECGSMEEEMGDEECWSTHERPEPAPEEHQEPPPEPPMEEEWECGEWGARRSGDVRDGGNGAKWGSITGEKWREGGRRCLEGVSVPGGERGNVFKLGDQGAEVITKALDRV